MKFEVKTDNHDISKSSFSFLLSFAILSVIVILVNISFKLGSISRYYEINYLCRLLIVEKTSSNFNKLSKLTSQTSKQNIWDFCREIVK